MLNFNNIMIGTDNLGPLVEFYTKVLGKPTMIDESYTGWLVGSGFITIGEHSEVHGKNVDSARVMWNFETKDVRSEFDRIKALGAKVIKEPYEPAPTYWIATFSDPDGNYFQLVSPWEE